MTDSGSRFLSPAEAAKKLGVGKSTVLHFIKIGSLRARRLGPKKTSRLLIPREALEAFVQSLPWEAREKS